MLTVFKMAVKVRSLTRPDLELRLEDVGGITEVDDISGGVQWKGKFKYEITDTSMAVPLMSGQYDMPDGARAKIRYVSGSPLIESAFVRESIMHLGSMMFEEKMKPFVTNDGLFQEDSMEMNQMNIDVDSIDKETITDVMMAQELLKTIIEPLMLFRLLPTVEYKKLVKDMTKVLNDGAINDAEVLSWNNRWAMDICSNGVAALMSKMFEIKIDIVVGEGKRVLH